MKWLKSGASIFATGSVKHKVWPSFANKGAFYAKSALDTHGPYKTSAEAVAACEDREAALGSKPMTDLDTLLQRLSKPQRDAMTAIGRRTVHRDEAVGSLMIQPNTLQSLINKGLLKRRNLGDWRDIYNYEVCAND